MSSLENLVIAIRMLWKADEGADTLMELVAAIGQGDDAKAEGIIQGLLAAPTSPAPPKLGDRFKADLAKAEPKDRQGVMNRWWAAVREERGAGR